MGMYGRDLVITRSHHWNSWDIRQTWNFFCKWPKNGIYRVVALDELIIFASYGYFPKRLFRAVEAVKVGWNLHKMTFFQFQVGMRDGVRKMNARVWRLFLLEVDLPQPLSIEILAHLWNKMTGNHQKKNFGFGTWAVQSIGYMGGSFLVFGSISELTKYSRLSIIRTVLDA